MLLSLTGGSPRRPIWCCSWPPPICCYFTVHERSDVPDDRDPKLSDMRTIAARENLPGYAHNHFMAVTPAQAGLVSQDHARACALGHQAARHARLSAGLRAEHGHDPLCEVVPPAEARTSSIFLSNYDGSWESYLEDFIMKAHAGPDRRLEQWRRLSAGRGC